MSEKRQRRMEGRAGQRGAALLMAMVILTLIATLASGMIWQQWKAMQVEAAERARTESGWILLGALDWARLILKEDAKGGGADHLGEPWAVPLAEARLSSFLAADKNATEDGPEAFLSGSISDAQGKYNLSNLIKDRKVDPVQLMSFTRVCEAIGVKGGAASSIANGLLRAQNGAAETMGAGGESADSGGGAPLLVRELSQLTAFGVDEDAIKKMGPYAVILPRPTPINVNTASKEALLAAVTGMDISSAERLVQARKRAPFKNIGEVSKVVPSLGEMDPARLSVKSDFFEVRGRLRLEDRAVEQVSLVERRGMVVDVIRRGRAPIDN